MTRVPVPDGYDGEVVPLPSSDDYDDFETAIEGHAGRRALVRTDDDGRCVGVSKFIAEDVAEYLGVDAPETGADASEENTGNGSDGDEDDESGEDAAPMSYEKRIALAEGLANEHWNTAKTAVEDGEADEYLDELAKADDRSSVQTAIDDRRAELED